MVVSGDITEHADAESFANFEQMFSGIGLPIAVVLGNHDGPAGIRSYAASSPQLADWHLTNRLMEIGGVRFLGLNISVEGLTQGALNDEALSLVDEQILQMEMLQAEGLKEPVLSKRKGMCCTEGRPAQRLKRVFNGAA